MRILKEYLWIKLFIFVFILLTIFFIFFSIFNIETHSSNIKRLLVISGNNTSNVILRSVYKAMLLNKKEEIREIFSNISKDQDVKLIRIYDKDGKIVFSLNEKEVGRTVDKKTEACYPCHKKESPPVFLNIYEKARTFHLKNSKVIGVITPILNSEECSQGDCHFHPPTQKVLGILDVALSMDLMYEALNDYRKKMLLWTFVIIFLSAFLVAFFIHKVIHSRVKDLIHASSMIQEGIFDINLKVSSEDELGKLANSFNKMAKAIKIMQEELLEWSSMLEKKVEEKTKEIEKIYSHMIHIEKMASLGKISSAVAHQINNPLSGILIYSKLLKKRIENIIPEQYRKEIIDYINIIEETTKSCGETVKNLLLFARKRGGHFVNTHLHQIIENSIILVEHEMELKGIKIEKELNLEDDSIICDINELQHSLIAILVNSIEAINEEGIIRVSTKEIEKDKVLIEIEDTGCGIPQDILPYVFEPFFTTKDSGTGLGLSVVYGVIKRHGGEVKIESEVNKGTKVKIFLPRNPKEVLNEEYKNISS
ncbi:MAG: ATP-binding protein [candidate division WOR-3 bacterium]